MSEFKSFMRCTVICRAAVVKGQGSLRDFASLTEISENAEKVLWRERIMWVRKTVLWQVLAWVALGSLLSRVAIAVPRQVTLISSVVATYNHDRLDPHALSHDLLEGRSQLDRDFIQERMLRIKGPLPRVRFSPKDDMILLQSGDQSIRLEVIDSARGEFELNGKALHVSPVEPLSVLWNAVERSLTRHSETSWMDLAIPQAHAAVLAIALCVLALVGLILLLLRESYIGWRDLQTLNDEAEKQLGPCEIREKQLRQEQISGTQLNEFAVQQTTLKALSQQLKILKAQLPECAKEEHCVPEMAALEDCLQGSVSIVQEMNGQSNGAITRAPEKGAAGPARLSTIHSATQSKSLR